MRLRLKPLHEQTIVITGATSGIGLTTTEMAADRGAKVILVSRDEEALRNECEKIKSRGGDCDYVEADIGKHEEVKRVAETVIERFGGFDTWVNNAGIGIYAPVLEASDEDHQKVIQTNYWGVVYGSIEAAKHLKYKGGALINIGSIASDMPTPILSIYAASKHAVKGFTDSLRLELQHDKEPVSVTLIKPSGIHTPFGDHARNYLEHASQVPPPVYHPEIAAKAILYAAEHPKREITVGGAGILQTQFAHLFPRLADRVFESAFYRFAVDKSRPNRGKSSLYGPSAGENKLGDQSGYTRRTSIATKVQTHPRITAIAGLALGAVALSLASNSRNGRNGRNGRRRGDNRRIGHQAQRMLQSRPGTRAF